MKILKILNNNVVIAKDEQGEEVIVMKLGLGFAKKTGDTFPREDGQKIFVLSGETKDQYRKLLKDINPLAVELAEKIITYAIQEKGLSLNDTIHLTLADHIDGLLARLGKNINMTNQLTLEISRVYTTDFEIGLWAKNLIEERTGFQLLKDEAAFIALHFVNSSKDNAATSDEVNLTVRFINDITAIIEKHYHRKIDEESFSYLRFVRHLKYMAKRIYSDALYQDDSTLYDNVAKSYPKSAECVKKIVRAIELKYKQKVSLEESAYLIIYVEKLIRE